MRSFEILLLAIGSVLIIIFPFLYKKFMQDWQDEVDQVGDYDPFKNDANSINEHSKDPEA